MNKLSVRKRVSLESYQTAGISSFESDKENNFLCDTTLSIAINHRTATAQLYKRKNFFVSNKQPSDELSVVSAFWLSF